MQLHQETGGDGLGRAELRGHLAHNLSSQCKVSSLIYLDLTTSATCSVFIPKSNWTTGRGVAFERLGRVSIGFNKGFQMDCSVASSNVHCGPILHKGLWVRRRRRVRAEKMNYHFGFKWTGNRFEPHMQRKVLGKQIRPNQLAELHLCY
jgi:hypothetical protein